MSEVRHFVHQQRASSPLGPRGSVGRLGASSGTVPLPETTLTLGLRQSGSASLHNQTLPNAVVSGLKQRARRVEHTAGSSVLIVRFTELGAPAILHDRVDRLPSRDQALNIARIHPGLHYGVTVEVREWTSPRETAAKQEPGMKVL
jgi:hypothetical protein